jgi:hypothetical protein
MTFDEELRIAEEENRREVAFIKKQLPSELKEKFSDDDLLWMTDAAADYYVSSGVLESTADEVDIDLEAVAQHVCQLAAQEGRPAYDAQEVFFVVQADLDFQEASA